MANSRDDVQYCYHSYNYSMLSAVSGLIEWWKAELSATLGRTQIQRLRLQDVVKSIRYVGHVRCPGKSNMLDLSGALANWICWTCQKCPGQSSKLTLISGTGHANWYWKGQQHEICWQKLPSCRGESVDNLVNKIQTGSHDTIGTNAKATVKMTVWPGHFPCYIRDFSLLYQGKMYSLIFMGMLTSILGNTFYFHLYRRKSSLTFFNSVSLWLQETSIICATVGLSRHKQF